MDIIINEKNYKYIDSLSHGSYVIKYFSPYINEDYQPNFNKELKINIELINKLGINNNCNKNYICYIIMYLI